MQLTFSLGFLACQHRHRDWRRRLSWGEYIYTYPPPPSIPIASKWAGLLAFRKWYMGLIYGLYWAELLAFKKRYIWVILWPVHVSKNEIKYNKVLFVSICFFCERLEWFLGLDVFVCLLPCRRTNALWSSFFIFGSFIWFFYCVLVLT